LHERHNHAERLDGDVVRRSLKRDVGSSENDRDKNGERGTLVATLLTQNGVVALTACISPHRRDAFRC
jgi:adenylylsulfate kinase-like enzyme